MLIFRGKPGKFSADVRNLGNFHVNYWVDVRNLGNFHVNYWVDVRNLGNNHGNCLVDVRHLGNVACGATWAWKTMLLDGTCPWGSAS